VSLESHASLRLILLY